MTPNPPPLMSRGEHLGRETMACAKCALVLYAGREKCPRCGQSFVAAPAPEELQSWPTRVGSVNSAGALNTGGAIYACREALGLSQDALGKRMNVKNSRAARVSKLENGKAMPSLRTIVKLCKAFDIPVPFFIALCEVPGL